jgi:hypothetical protein
MRIQYRTWSLITLSFVLLAPACRDLADPTAPRLEPPSGEYVPARIECHVSVVDATMQCERLPSSGGPDADRIVGGQDVYVLLASRNTVRNTATQELHTEVTVQNLLQQVVGTPDGVTVAGVRVFFHSGPTVTGGSGTVSIANPDGWDTLTGGFQPFFLYPQILTSYEISAPRHWVFSVPNTAESFVFTVLVHVPLPDPNASLLDAVWTGAAGTDWFTADNWRDGQAPDSSSVVVIPADSMIVGPGRPALSADAVVGAVRVGTGSELQLAGHSLEVLGNLDSRGRISGGTVHLSGSGARIGGEVDALRATAGVLLQRPIRATGAVSIADGSITITDQSLTISVP